MALKATVYKAELAVSDVDRHYYATHPLTLARHPSETDERLMIRLLAFALFADDALIFGRGLSTQDEPDLWQKDLTGDILHWIDVGQPEEQRLRRACGRARRVTVITYGGRASDLWWEKNGASLARLENLTVLDVPADLSAALAALASRSMQWQALIQDGELQLMSEAGTVSVQPRVRQRATR
jgi:uncharacterized protein YaeQ